MSADSRGSGADSNRSSSSVEPADETQPLRRQRHDEQPSESASNFVLPQLLNTGQGEPRLQRVPTRVMISRLRQKYLSRHVWQALALIIVTLMCIWYAVMIDHEATYSLSHAVRIRSNKGGGVHHAAPKVNVATAAATIAGVDSNDDGSMDSSQHSHVIDDGVVLGDSTDGVFHFMHVTDIHVSKFHKVGGLSHLLTFLSSVVPLVSPAFILATGDITDGKDEKSLSSLQQVDEWIAYQKALNTSGVLNRHSGQFWFDIRGNHDAFDVPNWNSSANLYKQFGSSSQANNPKLHQEGDGYSFINNEHFGSYKFVAMDACPRHGIARPMNFFGYVDRDGMDSLERRIIGTNENNNNNEKILSIGPNAYVNNNTNIVANSSVYNKANHTFLLSHYPVGTTVFGTSSRGTTFPTLTRHISVMLCGHLHTLALGLGRQLQAYKPTDYLELELGDLKLHALYRILVVDNDLISFVDRVLPLPKTPLPFDKSLSTTRKLLNNGNLTINEINGMKAPNAELPRRLKSPPIVIITNPKDARTLLNSHEPLHRIKSSTHLRMLIFADSNVSQVKVEIDGIYAGSAVYSGNSNATINERLTEEWWTDSSGSNGSPRRYTPLWTLKWNPSQYDDGGTHSVRVTVTDADGTIGEDEVVFRLDGQRVDFHNGGSGGWIMLTDWEQFLRYSVFGMFAFNLIMLLAARLIFLILRHRRMYGIWRQRTSRRLLLLDGHALAAYHRSPLPKILALGPYLARRLVFHVQSLGFRLIHLASSASDSFTFWILYFSTLYLIIGPWYSGVMIPAAKNKSINDNNDNSNNNSNNNNNLIGIDIDRAGVSDGWVYLYGIKLTNGEWVPTPDTLMTALLSVPLHLLVLPIYIALRATPTKWTYSAANYRRRFPYHRRWYIRLFVAACFFNIAVVGTGITAYVYGGSQTIVYGPGRAWLALLQGWLLWRWDWKEIFTGKRTSQSRFSSYQFNQLQQQPRLRSRVRSRIRRVLARRDHVTSVADNYVDSDAPRYRVRFYDNTIDDDGNSVDTHSQRSQRSITAKKSSSGLVRSISPGSNSNQALEASNPATTTTITTTTTATTTATTTGTTSTGVAVDSAAYSADDESRPLPSQYSDTDSDHSSLVDSESESLYFDFSDEGDVSDVESTNQDEDGYMPVSTTSPPISESIRIDESTSSRDESMTPRRRAGSHSAYDLLTGVQPTKGSQSPQDGDNSAHSRRNIAKSK